MKDRLKIFGEYHAGTWTRAREIETKVLTRYTPPEKWSLSDPDAWQFLKAALVGDAHDRREAAEGMPQKVRIDEQHLSFTQTYLIFTTDGGTCYCIGKDENRPRREDYPTELFPPSAPPAEPGPWQIPSEFPELPNGVKVGRIRYSDGIKENVLFTVTQTAPAVQLETEINGHSHAAEIEKLILHECDTEKEFRDKTDPSMREFYVEYVQGPDTLKAIAKRRGWSERTLKNRKKELEKHMAGKLRSKNFNLHKLKHDPLMKEARRLAGKDPVEKLRKKHAKTIVRSRFRDMEAQSEIEKAERQEEAENRRRIEERKRQFSKG